MLKSKFLSKYIHVFVSNINRIHKGDETEIKKANISTTKITSVTNKPINLGKLQSTLAKKKNAEEKLNRRVST